VSKRDELLKSLGGGGFKGMVGETTPPGLDPAAAKAPDHSRGMTRRKDVWSIPLALIEPDPDQPRTEYDEEALGRLAESLKARGQLQPIRVRKDEGRGVYVILLGERRFRAAKRAGLAELQCIVHDGDLGPDEKLMVQLVENCVREDLRPVEQARAYRKLLDSQGWSISQLGRELAVSQAGVSKALALLELPPDVQEAVEQGGLAPTTAYEISRLDDAADQRVVAQAAEQGGLRRAEVAQLVESLKAKRPAPAAKPEPVTMDLGDGTQVRISWRKANGTDAIKALKLALRRLQEQQRDGQAA
jgi:ParB family transcriptional regulator, chromosome partitioning protein